MLFNSVPFVAFLLVVLIIYSLLKSQARLYFLLTASYFFYGCWSIKYLLLIFFTSASCFSAGLLLSKKRFVTSKKLILTFSIVINFGILFVYKYFNFFIDVVSSISRALNHKISFLSLDILLPVGISFYTFHSISYVIDVYKGRVPTEKSLPRFLLFVSFFPQLVAGPIARSESLLPQLQTFKDFKYDNFRRGFVLIFWGLFKKVVIADRLALGVNNVFDHIPQSTTAALIIAAIFFSFQIYCDFSGYSDIALGISKLFGVDLMINFRSPYFAKTVTEFWRRWHISLSTWFKDYLYIPLGGNKGSQGKWIFNTLLVFVVSGLWHGANYTFLIWGAIHGLLLILEKFFYGKKIRDIKSGVTFLNILRWVFTYVIIVIAWVFFRANNLSDALLMIKKMFDFTAFPGSLHALLVHNGTKTILNMNMYDVGLGLIFILILMFVDYIFKENDFTEFILKQSTAKRWTFYLGITFVVLWFGIFGTNSFIYFQF